MIRAILWAQFLSMRLRKGGAVRGSAVFSAITGTFFYVVFAFLGWVLETLFSSPEVAANFVQVLSAVLLIATLYWQLAPVITASFGASIDLRKLMA